MPPLKFSVLILALLVSPPSIGSALFDDDSLLEVTLSGPLSTLIKRKKRDREEYPFTLRVDGKAIDLEIRVRGNSRVSATQA